MSTSCSVLGWVLMTEQRVQVPAQGACDLEMTLSCHCTKCRRQPTSSEEMVILAHYLEVSIRDQTRPIIFIPPVAGLGP